MFVIDYFNQLDFNLRMFLYFIILVIILITISNIFRFITSKVNKAIKTSYIKYKDFSEKKFNTLLIEHLTKKIKATDKFIVFCTFEFKDFNQNTLEIMTNFAQAFSNYFKVIVKFDKNSLIFIFNNFSTTVNTVIDQFYLIQKSRGKQYKGLDIYMSITELEEESKYFEQLNLLKKMNTLKVTKKMTCGSSFNFYYCTINYQKYKINSVGDYAFDGITELFTIDKTDQTS